MIIVLGKMPTNLINMMILILFESLIRSTLIKDICRHLYL